MRLPIGLPMTNYWQSYGRQNDHCRQQQRRRLFFRKHERRRRIFFCGLVFTGQLQSLIPIFCATSAVSK
jgi:hypothetical protein